MLLLHQRNTNFKLIQFEYNCTQIEVYEFKLISSINRKAHKDDSIEAKLAVL